MATEKTVNYTEAQVTEMREAFVASPTKETVEAIAAKFGKTVKSVVAKLVREGVYKAADKATGKRPMLKSEMVGEIAKEIGATDEQLESLEKATGPALMLVLKALKGE